MISGLISRGILGVICDGEGRLIVVLQHIANGYESHSNCSYLFSQNRHPNPHIANMYAARLVLPVARTVAVSKFVFDEKRISGPLLGSRNCGTADAVLGFTFVSYFRQITWHSRTVEIVTWQSLLDHWYGLLFATCYENVQVFYGWWHGTNQGGKVGKRELKSEGWRVIFDPVWNTVLILN